MTEIKMPQGGQTTDASVIVRWRKEEGDEVKRGDVLFEVETDKAVLEIESYANGILLKKCYEAGDSVKTGEVCAYIGAKGESVCASQAPVSSAPAVSAPDSGAKAPLPVAATDVGAVKASPAAKKLLRDAGVSLAEVAASMPGKILRLAACQAYLQAQKAASQERAAEIAEEPKAAPGPVADGDFTVLPTGKMRKTIARRLTQSVREVPQFTVGIEVNCKELVAYRNQLNAYLAGEDLKVSYNDLIMAAACKAIKSYPLINAQYGEEEIHVFGQVNFGLAVSTGDGLVVPTVKSAQALSIVDLARQNKKNIALAREGKAPAVGGTITLSSLGSMDVAYFTAILNPPESCILACAKILDSGVMRITGTFDHRLIDGAYAGEFMTLLKKFLEVPTLISIC